MKKTLSHIKRVHRASVSPKTVKHELQQQRADLSTLLYTMEHDSHLNPPIWQVESLKKTLMDIEHQLRQSKSHRKKT